MLLVNPTKERLFEQPSLGLLYIGAALKKAGHSVEYLEGSGKQLEMQIYWRMIWKEFNPDVIGFTVMSPMFNEVKNLAQLIHYEWATKGLIEPRPVIVAGGAHTTLMPETLLEAGVDYCILGEGEDTIVDLLNHLHDPHRVRGIAWQPPWNAGEQLIEYTEKREPLLDLDVLPFPARELLPRKYFKRHSTSILASRGCPYNCSYCQPTLRRLFGSTVRRRSVINVLEEMNQIYHDHGVTHFEFFDDTFTANKKWVVCFCHALQDMVVPEGKKRITWEILTRVNAIDEDLLRIMKAAGLTRITFGVESGSQEILDYYRKGTTKEQTRSAFSMCHSLEIHTHALFMLGAPIETLETIAATEKLIKEIKPSSIFISITTPLPYTGLWDECMKNQTMTLDWSKINYYHKPSIKLEHLTPDQVIQARERILRSFYLRHPWFVVKFLRQRGWSYSRTAIGNLFGGKEK